MIYKFDPLHSIRICKQYKYWFELGIRYMMKICIFGIVLKPKKNQFSSSYRHLIR